MFALTSYSESSLLQRTDCVLMLRCAPSDAREQFSLQSSWRESGEYSAGFCMS